jgi:hypothetical protein
MGLDMYINRKVHGYRKDDGTLSPSLEDYKSDEFGCANSEWVETEVAYWRKANAIHNWFVNNVQDGQDECQESEIDTDTIKRLRELCLYVFKRMKGMVLRVPKKDVEKYKEFYEGKEGFKQRITIDPDNLDAIEKVTGYHVVSDHSICKEILPTTSGFFFGNTEYGGDYFWSLLKTIRMCDRILKEDKELRAKGFYPEYTYMASW